MRIFIVVAKNRPDLYHYFKSGFAGVDSVEVVLDRRLGVGTDVPSPPAPRPEKRRATSDIYDELEMRGFVIVRLPD